MAWLDRFTFVMKSTLTTLRERVEDPEMMLHQLVCDMEEELESVRRGVAAALADQIQLQKELDSARSDIEKWDTRSAQALRQKDESGARQALGQKLRAVERAEKLEDSCEQRQLQAEELQSSFRDLEDKIRQAQHRRTLLVARLARARSQRSIHDALDRATGTSAFAEFSRLERKVERAESLSQAYDKLDGRDPEAAQLEARFARDERKARLEAELEELRRRVTTPAS